MSEIKEKLLELIMSMSEDECGEVASIMSTPICVEGAKKYMEGQITQQEFDRILCRFLKHIKFESCIVHQEAPGRKTPRSFSLSHAKTRRRG